MFDKHDLIEAIKMLSKHDVASGKETGVLKNTIESILSRIDSARRGMNAIEANCLVAATEALKKGHFALARANILHALQEVREHHHPNRFPLLSVNDMRQRPKSALHSLPHSH